TGTGREMLEEVYFRIDVTDDVPRIDDIFRNIPALNRDRILSITEARTAKRSTPVAHDVFQRNERLLLDHFRDATEVGVLAESRAIPVDDVKVLSDADVVRQRHRRVDTTRETLQVSVEQRTLLIEVTESKHILGVI